jgi:hypothetical protein
VFDAYVAFFESEESNAHQENWFPPHENFNHMRDLGFALARRDDDVGIGFMGVEFFCFIAPSGASLAIAAQSMASGRFPNEFSICLTCSAPIASIRAIAAGSLNTSFITPHPQFCQLASLFKFALLCVFIKIGSPNNRILAQDIQKTFMYMYLGT